MGALLGKRVSPFFFFSICDNAADPASAPLILLLEQSLHIVPGVSTSSLSRGLSVIVADVSI